MVTDNKSCCSYPPYFELTQHLSLSAPQDLSAPLHLFTSHVSFHLSTHHSSLYLWPNTRFRRLPTALTASHPPFNTIIFFFSDPLAPFHPIPPSQPPTLISLPLPKSLSSPSFSRIQSFTHPLILLSPQPAQSEIGGITCQFGNIHTCLSFSAGVCTRPSDCVWCQKQVGLNLAIFFPKISKFLSETH